MSPQTPLLIIPGVVEYAALVTGALSGSLMAVHHKLDIVGVAGLALITGLGGGLLRDIILQTGDVYMLTHPIAVIACLVIAVLAFFFRALLDRVNALTLMMWVDIFSVAFFAFAGADKALVAGCNAITCVLLGLITAVGGGAIRDVCLAEVPTIFRRGTYYAIAALAGAIVYVLLAELWVSKIIALAACVVVTVALRVVSVRFNVQSMQSVDFTPTITRPLRRAWLHMLANRRRNRR